MTNLQQLDADLDAMRQRLIHQLAVASGFNRQGDHDPLLAGTFRSQLDLLNLLTGGCA